MVKIEYNPILMIFILVNLLSVCAYTRSIGNDTLVISLKDAEEKFLKENLQLIASKYNITAAEAQITQAKLWSNPNLSIEQNIYNQSTKRYFDFTRTGNTEFQISQLFLLAGKKKSRFMFQKSINK